MSAVLESQRHFRDMAEEDVPSVMALERKGHAFPWTEGIFRDCIRVGYVCTVLEEQGAIIAYGVMSIAAGEAHVFNVCVDPGRRNKGLGGEVMEYLIEKARRRNANSIFLEVRPSNEAAVALYDRLGFNQIGNRKDYYPDVGGREDALIFARDL
ncbi:MAG: ribosomal protein S18-alanine N-acetyltransferase [Gammaproteobacteria bacterium]|nr:ribosomal protein S18-alanine N-acetyltransferase [Gammaproteobacteria bacterium]